MSKTKFFIEAIPLIEERPSGVGHALLGLVTALVEDSVFQEQYEIVLVVPKRALSRLDRWPALRDCSRKGLPLRLRILNGLMKFHLLPPMDILLGRGIYLFGNFKNWPVTKRSFSLTYIHDIAFALYPQFVALKNQRMLSKNVPKFIAQTDVVITVSQASKEEITEYYKLDPKKVLVLYNGVDTKLYHSYSKEEIASAKQRYGINKKYFIFVGSIEPRKNLLRLIEAFRELPKQNALVLIGGSGWLNEEILHAIEDAKRQDVSIIQPDTYVSDEDCARLMSGAIALVHPALHEGFGMPPAEALSTETPVLASDIPVLHEVLGIAGAYFDPLNVESIREAMQHASSLTASQRTQLAKKGIIQSKRFTWGGSAKVLLQFLNKTGK